MVNSEQTPQASTGTVQIDATYMYRAINNLQAKAANRDNDENRASLLLAINAMVKQANANERLLTTRKEEDRYLSDPLVQKTVTGGVDDGHTVFAWAARRD